MHRLILGLSLVAMLISCAGGQPVPVNLTDCPDWVFRGGGAMDDNGKKAFYGVGAVRGIRNHALAKSTADNRARAEIARTLKVYSASLMKDYMASTTAGDMTASSEEQHVEQAIKTFAAATMTGVVITEHWFAPDGTVYALARIDFDNVKKSLAMTEAFKPAVPKAEEKFEESVPPPPEPPPPAEEGTCVLQLRVIQVKASAPGCYIDEKISGSIGTLTYPCNGGDAEADFGKVQFTGTVAADAVELNLHSEYVYAPYDKCTWYSDQKLSGTLATGQLLYDYDEGRLPGQKNCDMDAVPCSGDGNVLMRKP